MLRRRPVDLGALAAYVGISCALFGWRLVPHPGRVEIGQGHDSIEFIWSFGWWTHAIGAVTNPFVSHAVYTPSGINLTWTPTSPGLAILFAPLTAIVGPVASFNVAMLLAPAVSAWAAYLLCRHVTSSVWASAIGGFAYGFSTANMRQFLTGNLDVTAVFVLPLVALVIVRYVRSELNRRGLAWRIGVLLAVQLWIFTEFALTMVLLLGLGLAAAYVFVPRARERLVASIKPIIAGGAIGAGLASPFVAYLLIGFVSGRFTGPIRLWGTDPLGYIVPNKITGIGGQWFLTFANHTPNGDLAYLGVPLVLVVCAFAFRYRREGWGRFLVVSLLLLVALALGITLSVEGHTVLHVPWASLWDLPPFDNVLPARFAIDIALVVGVMAALWIDRTKGSVFRRPYVLPVLAVASLVPAFWDPSEYMTGHPQRVAFFTRGIYSSCLGPDATVAAFPFGIGSESLLWQAESEFAFNLAEDGLQPIPDVGKPISGFDRDQVVSDLNSTVNGYPTVDRLLAFAALHHVDRIVALPGADYPTRGELAQVGTVQLIGGVLVAPACGQPSLRTRNLTRFVDEYRQELAIPTRPMIGYCVPGTFTTLPEGLLPAKALAGATRAIAVEGVGITCDPPPAGFRHEGYATGAVPPDTYAYYAKP